MHLPLLLTPLSFSRGFLVKEVSLLTVFIFTLGANVSLERISECFGRSGYSL